MLCTDQIALRFSRPALDYLRNIPHRVITIDGEKLIDLMVEYGIGVRVKQSFLLHRIDENFFIDE
jgi:restriction system protein